MTTYAEQMAATMPEHYGLRATGIGEESDVLILGHQPARRALAAANRLARVEWGLLNLADDREVDCGWFTVRHLWAVPAHKERCPSGPGEVIVRAADGDPVEDGDVCACDDASDGEWWLNWQGVTEQTPGAIPVSVVTGL